MPPEEEFKKDGQIKRLHDRLYSRETKPVTERERRELHEQEDNVDDAWTPLEPKLKGNMNAIIKILLGVSVIFFIGAAVLSAFFFFRVPAISPQNVEIEIQGPASIGGGDELGLQISITNNNPVAIENVDLIVEYPDGTRSIENINQALPRYREALGTIKEGDQVRKTVRAILFGEEGSVQDIKVVVEFRVVNSNAIFFNDAVYQLSLSESPLSLVIDTLKEAISGQEVVIEATITSNSNEVLEDVLFEVEYPFGFEFESAFPPPVFVDRLWQLGDIAPEGEKTIRIRGKLVGQDGEERVFRFKTGIESESSPNTLESVFINTIESIVVKRPFITIDLALDGDNGDIFVAQTGKKVRGDITWTNNLPSQIFDAEIELRFNGQILDEQSVSAENGFYDSLTDRIIWTRETNSKLASIPAGDTGRVRFEFSPLGLSSGIPFRNPQIDIDVSVKAKRLSDRQVPEEIISTLARRVNVETNLILSTKALHFTGPLSNTGPIPPRAEQGTTFTIVWAVTNSSSEIENATVIATLPPFISWGDLVSSPAENISYNPVGGIITWKVGDVAAGTGTVLPAREIAFQVKLVPSLSQIGVLPDLINETTISGHDIFSDTNISRTSRSLTTGLREAGFNSGDGQVTF